MMLTPRSPESYKGTVLYKDGGGALFDDSLRSPPGSRCPVMRPPAARVLGGQSIVVTSRRRSECSLRRNSIHSSIATKARAQCPDGVTSTGVDSRRLAGAIAPRILRAEPCAAHDCLCSEHGTARALELCSPAYAGIDHSCKSCCFAVQHAEPIPADRLRLPDSSFAFSLSPARRNGRKPSTVTGRGRTPPGHA